MAALEKFTLKELKNVGKESYREQTTKPYKNFVDATRTKENYSYNYDSSSAMLKAMKKRILDILDGEDPKQGTKVGSWAVTCPKELKDDPKLTRLFFDTTKEFLENRYGKENLIDMVVHMDETTPHATAYIVPEAISRKSGKKTVSTASCFTRTDLQSFHDDFDKYCENVFGVSGLVKNGQTKDAKNMKELKQKTLEELQQENERLSAIVEAQETHIQALETQVKELQARVSEKPEKTPQKASESVKVEQKVKRVQKASESLQKPQIFRPQKASLLFSYMRAAEKGDKEVMHHNKKMYETYFPESNFETEYERYKADQREKRVRQSSTITIRTDDRQGDYQRE